MSLEPVQTEADVDLREYVEVTWRRKWVVLSVVMLALAACYALIRVSDPIFASEARFVIEAEAPRVNMVEVDNPLAAMLTKTQPDTLPTQIQVMRTPAFFDSARKRVKAKLPPGADGPSVQVQNLEGTQIVSVRVECGSPKYAAELANSMVNLHLERLHAHSMKGIREALAFVEREVSGARGELARSEDRLALFRKQYRLEEATARQEQQFRESLDLTSRVRQLRADQSGLEAEVSDLRSQLANEPETLTQVTELDNPRVQQLRDRLAELEQQRAAALVDYKPTSPIVKQLDVQIDDVSKRLQKEPITRENKTKIPNPSHLQLTTRLREREDELRRVRGEYNRANGELQARQATSTPTDLGAWEVRLGALNRDKDQTEKRHAVLLEKLQDLRIREKANVMPARVLSSADVPEKPVFPDPTRMYTVAAALGLILGLCCAFLAERWDDRVHTPEEAERLAHVGLLGHVPQMGLQSPRLVSQLPAHSIISESYRALRSSIAFAALDAPVRTMMVTSMARGEGKSLTTVNLATAMAMDGKRVILIDADLRRPNIHSLLRLDREPGLTNLLYDRCSLETAIRPTATPNLHVICSGPIPSHPSELLNTTKMTELLDTLAADYDLVMIDTPPCLPVTDALVLSAKVDGVVLVVDVGKTRKGALRYARELLHRARARVLGVVFNRAGRDGGMFYSRYGYKSSPFSDMMHTVNTDGVNGVPSREGSALMTVGADRNEDSLQGKERNS